MKFVYDGGAIVYTYRRRTRLFLFLKNPDGWLDIPKGHVEKGETSEQAAVRETFEEAGLEVELDRFFRHASNYWYKEKGETVRKTLVTFLTRVAAGTRVKISEEHAGYEWLGFEDAMERISFADLKELLAVADDYISRKEEMDRLNGEYRGLPGRTKGWGLSMRYVPGEGPLNAKVMFVGQAPGRFEDAGGRPFIGTSGKLLDMLMGKAGLRRSQVYITSVVQFFPPGNRMPDEDEVATCRRFLIRQIGIVKPKVVVLLGSLAAMELCGEKEVMKKHGSLVEGAYTYFITLHPAAAVRMKKRLPIVESDFKKLREIVKAL